MPDRIAIGTITIYDQKDGDSITVTDTSTTAAGVTTVTFSDGTYITVNDGYTPVKGTDYSDGNNVRVEYSINGNDGWVSTQVANTTYLYIRTAVDTNNDGNYVAGESTKFVPELGVEYNNGNPGDPAYLHIKYSNNGTSFTGNSGETLGTYIGTLSDSTQADSSTFGDYTWQKYIGTDGSGSGVQVLYADSDNPADNTVVFEAQGTHTYVYYYEWTGTSPTAIPDDAHEKTFVKFIGTDGTAEGVVPIYSSVEAPTNVNQLSFDIGSRRYVTFFEWTGTSPPSIVADHLNETYIKFVGNNIPEGFRAIPAYSNQGYSTVKYDEDNGWLTLQSDSDTAIGMAYPAFNVETAKYKGIEFKVTFKGTQDRDNGIYIRVYEYDYPLPTGKLAISNSATNSAVQEDTRKGVISSTVEHAPVTVAWQTKTFTYTPSATAKWASIVILNWTGMANDTLYVRSVIGSGSDALANSIYYTNTTEIDGGNIKTGTISASHIDTNTLSSIVADLGTITAGKMQSSDGLFVIDLDNKFIKIEV